MPDRRQIFVSLQITPTAGVSHVLTFDLLTVAAMSLGLLTGMFSALRKTALPGLLAGAALIAGLAHVVIEGTRWQLAPGYFVLAGWLVVLVAKVTPGAGIWLANRPRWLVLTTRGSAFALLALSLGASYLFPMFQLPQPSGPLPIGTTTLHFTDQSRREPHTVAPFDRRELLVHVWYPSAPKAAAKPVAYMENADVMSPALAKGFSVPLPFAFTHFKLIPTHSFAAAPLSGEKVEYPVLVFSHGRDIYAVAYTALMEDLASRGYVVFAIDHTYGAMATALPDGRVATFVEDVYERHGRRPPTSPEEQARIRAVSSSTDPHEISAFIQQTRRADPEHAAFTHYGIAIWSDDQRFVLDEIQKLQSGQVPSLFAGHLDLSKLGIFGMSFGGSATVMTCSADPRCKAGLNLDGFSPELLALPPAQQPFLYASGGEQNFNLALFDRGPNWNYWLKVVNSRHGDFTDLPLVTPLWKFAHLSGSIPPYRMLGITNNYVAAFFDKHLRGAPAPLLDGPSPRYPEVLLRIKPPGHTPTS